MAFAEKRGDWYRLVFRLAGKRYTHTLKTQSDDIAQGVAGGVNRTLMLDGGMVRIPEKKRVHGKRTSRRVPLSAFLANVLRDWLAIHPGGPHLFSQHATVKRSKKKRLMATPITRDEVHDHLKRTLAESKWKVVRGWHLFRHSFISLCVMRGIDQRLIDSWVGHTTEDMRRRYTHLYPSAEKQAIQSVFGN